MGWHLRQHVAYTLLALVVESALATFSLNAFLSYPMRSPWRVSFSDTCYPLLVVSEGANVELHSTKGASLGVVRVLAVVTLIE